MDISTYPYISITALIKEVRCFAHEGFFFAAAKIEIRLRVMLPTNKKHCTTPHTSEQIKNMNYIVVYGDIVIYGYVEISIYYYIAIYYYVINICNIRILLYSGIVLYSNIC